VILSYVYRSALMSSSDTLGDCNHHIRNTKLSEEYSVCAAFQISVHITILHFKFVPSIISYSNTHTNTPKNTHPNIIKYNYPTHPKNEKPPHRSFMGLFLSPIEDSLQTFVGDKVCGTLQLCCWPKPKELEMVCSRILRCCS
jgi:hypothetical protein